MACMRVWVRLSCKAAVLNLWQKVAKGLKQMILFL